MSSCEAAAVAGPVRAVRDARRSPAGDCGVGGVASPLCGLHGDPGRPGVPESDSGPGRVPDADRFGDALAAAGVSTAFGGTLVTFAGRAAAFLCCAYGLGFVGVVSRSTVFGLAYAVLCLTVACPRRAPGRVGGLSALRERCAGRWAVLGRAVRRWRGADDRLRVVPGDSRQALACLSSWARSSSPFCSSGCSAPSCTSSGFPDA